MSNPIKFRVTIHCEADSLVLLEPIAKHLGHIEVAIDAPPPEPRVTHPLVTEVMAADRDADKRRFTTERLSAAKARLDREERRKREARALNARLSPKVIDAVPCPTCGAGIGHPCQAPSGGDRPFGRKGHTHQARRESYQTWLVEMKVSS